MPIQINSFQTHTVPKINQLMRLSDYGIGLFGEVHTKSALKKAIKKNCFKVNGKPACTGTYVREGDCIQFSPPAPVSPKKKLILELKVLYEDDYLALIHKPAGILVSGNKFMTVKNALEQNLEKSSQPYATSPQPIHRLDYATTGILLVGKTISSIRALNKMFENKEIKKSYRAISIGEMKAQGEICNEIDGKEAKSHFKVLDSVDSERFEKLNLVELIPETGRRHQLRKHLHSIGHPILGDKDYFLEGLILKGKGMYLHAYSLEFRHPITSESMRFTCDLPKKFRKIFSP